MADNKEQEKITDAALGRYFSHLLTPQNQVVEDENTREFIGDGTAFIRCPGLISVERVTVEGVEIPTTMRQQVVIDVNGNKDWMTVPLLAVIKGADGSSILVRSTQSNHGVWQRDVRFYITGTWEDNVKLSSEEDDKNENEGGKEKPKPPAGEQKPVITPTLTAPVAKS